MKKNVLALSLLLISALMLTACGNQASVEVNIATEVDNGEAVTKNSETSESTEPSTDIDKSTSAEITEKLETVEKAETISNAAAEQTVQPTFTIPEQWMGTYAEYVGYNQEYVTIDASAVTYYQSDVPYVYGAENFEAVMEEDGSKVSIMKDDTAYMVLQFSVPEEMPSLELEIYRLEEEELSEPIHFEQEKTTILNYLPTTDYVHLDDLGPWGAIPYEQKIADILLKNQDEDYLIEYKDNVPMPIFSSDMMSIMATYNCDCYSIMSYNEEGYMKKSWASYVVFEDAEAAKAYCEYWCSLGSAPYVDYAVEENVFYYQEKQVTGEQAYDRQNTKLSSLEHHIIAADTHCVYAGNQEYTYYSKPVTAQQCEKALAVEKLIQQMHCKRTEAVEGNAYIQIQGHGIQSGCIIETGYYEAFTVNADDVTAKGNTLLFMGEENLEPYVTVAEVTKEGEILTVHARIYPIEENVNFDNYLEKSVYKDLTYTFHLSEN